MPKNCLFCGQSFESKRNTAKYCSHTCCAHASHKRLHPEWYIMDSRNCEYCNNHFETRHSDRRFCSVACQQQSYYSKFKAGLLKYRTNWRVRNLERARFCAKTAAKKRRLQLRVETMEAYGGKCTCCGETHPEFLAIDHVANNGAQHRKTVRRNFYEWLKANNWPPGFQILCHNCNMAKAFYGYCPHWNNQPTALRLM